MKLIVAPPSLGDSRGIYADWIELQVLLQSRPASISAMLSNVVNIESDSATDEDWVDSEFADVVDSSIVDRPRDRLEQMVVDELEYRQAIVGDAYPFKISGTAATLQLDWADPSENWGKSVYIFCLLVSAIRNSRVSIQLDSEQIKEIARKIPNAFQTSACLAAGGYLGGAVASFGFPRANGMGFLEALRTAYGRFGAGTVVLEIPAGFPASVKDDGVDIIAWRDHPDKMPGKIYLLGQCASGSNWTEKSMTTYVSRFHIGWFTRAPAVYVIPAIFIPFAIHGSYEEHPSEPYGEVTRGRFWRHETEFGIVFDRLRIAHYAKLCQLELEKGNTEVEGADRFGLVEEWLGSVLDLAPAQVAA